MPRNWTEEQIAAEVDRSLEGAEAKAARDALYTDPEAQSYAEDLRRMNHVLRAAFDIPDDEPMPAPIAAALHGEDGKFAVLRRPLRRQVWVSAAVAASLALAIGIGGYTLNGEDAPPSVLALGEVPADGPLHLALETLASGSMSPAGVRPVQTFLDSADRPCREFDVATEKAPGLEAGIACRTDAGRWNVEVVFAPPAAASASDGYAPAAGPDSGSIDEAMEALGAGQPLSNADEAALISAGWVAAQ